MHLLGLTFAQFAAFAALSVAAVAALYALKQRRRTVVVSFTPLWERVTADPRRTSVFEKLRRVLSFLVQAAFVLLVLAAIARPRLGGDAEPARRFVLVIDLGPSMQARLDAGSARTRLDEAKSLAKSFVMGLGKEDSVALVTPGGVNGCVAPFESDRTSLLQSIDALRAGDAASDVESATRFAVSLAGGRPDRVVVFSRIGKPLDNVAITKFAVRALAESPGEYGLFWEVANFGRADAHPRIRIERAGAIRSTLDDRALDLAPGARVSDVLRGLADNDVTIEARIVGPGGRPWEDALSTDDSARATLRSPRVIRTLVVGTPDFFLDAALRSDPFVAFSRVAPADYAGPGDADVVIFDSSTPGAKELPARAIWLNPPATGSPVGSRGEIRDVFVDRTESSHPVMRWVGSLSDVAVAKSRVLAPGANDSVLASCAGSPVIIARERGQSRLVAIGFDLRESDLPLRVAFPKIIRNAVRWTATGETLDPGSVSGIEPRDETSHLLASFESPEPVPAEAAENRSEGMNLWPLLAAMALALTLFEWLSYHRRWTV